MFLNYCITLPLSYNFLSLSSHHLSSPFPLPRYSCNFVSKSQFKFTNKFGLNKLFLLNYYTKTRKSVLLLYNHINFVREFLHSYFISLYTNFFFKKLLPQNLYLRILNGILFTGNVSLLCYTCQFLLWQIPVPKHRFWFLFVRKFCKKLFFFGNMFNLIKSIGFFFKGKLSVTGNKRKRTFCGNWGSRKNSFYSTFKCITIRTTTGILNFWIYIEY